MRVVKEYLSGQQEAKSILPAAGRLILETALPQEEVIKLFRKSIEIIK